MSWSMWYPDNPTLLSQVCAAFLVFQGCEGDRAKSRLVDTNSDLSAFTDRYLISHHVVHEPYLRERSYRVHQSSSWGDKLMEVGTEVR